MSALVVAAGLARMLVAPDSPAPVMQPDDAVLFVKRSETCPVDGGVPDAGGTDAGVADAAIADAAVPDGGVPDAGVPDAGATMCGDSVMMVVQPRFSIGVRGSRFALLYVTPGPPSVRLESPTTFEDLATATAPEIYTVTVPVEDPSLGTECRGCGGGGARTQGGGCGGGGYTGWTPPTLDGGVTGSTIQTIGPYDVANVQAASRTELAHWLDKLGYVYSSADLDAIDPYLAMGWYVVAVRIAETAQLDGGLQPLSMTWAGSEIRVPLGLASQDALTVYIAAAHRIELPGAHIAFAGCLDCRTPSGFVTRNEIAGGTADLTAYVSPTDAITRDEQTIYEDVHVPVNKCDDQGCCQSGTGPTNGMIYLGALGIALRRRRRQGRL